MKFEWDPKKSEANKEKHGIDFVESQAIWDDENRQEIPAMVVGEERYAVIGRIGGKIWTAIITYRGETVRIISVRRAHGNEEKRYNG